MSNIRDIKCPKCGSGDVYHFTGKTWQCNVCQKIFIPILRKSYGWDGKRKEVNES